LPQSAKDTLNYIENNPAMMKAIGAGDGGNSSTVTEKNVENFIGHAEDDAKAGSKAYDDFIKKNPDASDSQKALAQSASIVLGNQTLFSAGSTDPKRLVDGHIRADDLANIALTQGFGSTLKDAATLWSNPGMFAQLDTGGEDASTAQPDQIADSKNVSDWISKQLPSIKDVDMGAFLSDAAMRNITTDIDVSKLGPDVFANPQNYTGHQKAAVMQQLTDLDAKLKGGIDGSSWDGDNVDLQHAGINSDPNMVEADVENKIAQLSSDPDVQKWLQYNYTGSLQTIASSDPAFQAGLNSFYKGDLQSGKALNDALGGKDVNGQKVTPEDGLQTFVRTADVLTQALGTNGAPLPSLDLQSIVQKSGQVGALQQAYTNDIVSGNELSNNLNDGMSMATAVQQFLQDSANFGAVLPSDVVSNNASTLQQNFSDTISNFLESNASADDLTTALGNDNGNVDSSKVTDAINQLEKTDPGAFTDSNGVKIKPDQIINAVNSVVADVRGGAKLNDALVKLANALKSDSDPTLSAPKGVVADVYNKGLLHVAGAVLNGAVFAAKIAENHGKGTPTVEASALASGIQMMGGLLEGGSKYAKATNFTPFSSDELKGIESAGKFLGGAGSIIGGAVGIFSGVISLKDGDKAGGGVSIATGITSTLSGVSSAIEGGLGIAESLGETIPAAVTAGFAATSATLGIVGGVVTGLAMFGLGLYQLIKGVETVDKYDGQIESVFKQWGITGGDGVSANPPQEPAPPVEP
jgi:hypothetical protein